MTTERTPQDVLRELRREIEQRQFPADQRGYAVGGWNQAIENVLEIIDKAIAEAPDSPPEGFVVTDPEWDAPDGARVLFERIRGRWEPIEKAPDTLSEKPGLDVERLARAMQEWMGRGPVIVLPMVQAEELGAIYDRLGSTDSEGQ